MSLTQYLMHGMTWGASLSRRGSPTPGVSRAVYYQFAYLRVAMPYLACDMQ